MLMRTGPEISGTFSYEKFLKNFPGHITLAFAYGSGVFPQKNNEDVSKKMLDFIFVVKDAKKWHTKNLEMNYKHYSMAGKFANSEWFEKAGAGVHFNTGIEVQNRKLKYGVISHEKLIDDLKHWNTMYVSGRLHKPVHIIHHNFNREPQLLKALKKNLTSAALCSFLLLPDMFTEEEFYLTITGLSYLGDIRMGVAEDKNKVSNIVSTNMRGFKDLYSPVLHSFLHPKELQYADFLMWNKKEGRFIQNKSIVFCHQLIKSLPTNLVFEMCCVYDKEAKHIRDIEEIVKSMARYPELEDVIQKALINIVAKSSRSQTLKNITTVSPLEAIKYGSKKFGKMVLSKFDEKPHKS